MNMQGFDHKLIYISHHRFPSDKTHAAFAMRTCENFKKLGISIEMWVPWRWNHQYGRQDPLQYYGIKHGFVIRRIPAIDVMPMFPGRLGFYLLVASFNLSLGCYYLLEYFKGKNIFYSHDARDLILLNFFRPIVFLEIHDFYKSTAEWVNRLIFKRITGFIVTNKFKIGVLSREYGVLPEKMLHQPNAVDLEKFGIKISKEEARRKLSLPQGKKIILYTGHLFGWKGVDTLLAAAEFISKDSLIYFVGGTNEDVEGFKLKRDKLGFDNVVVVGGRPYDEIPVWLKSADVLVLPNTAKDQASKYETSPVKLFEYMTSGVPIVASDLPSIRDIVDDKSVWFFNADEPLSLAETIKKVFQSKEEVLYKSRSALERVRQCDWGLRAENIISFIKGLV